MKIAIYSTQIIPSNPDLKQYGGLELIAGLQAKYFAEQGHEVHLFASKNSYFSTDKDGKKPFENGFLYAVGDPGKINPMDAWKAYLNDPKTKQVLKDADIICDHSWNYYPYSVHHELKNICHICHGPDPGFNPQNKPPVSKPNFIAVSHNHAKQLTKQCGITFRGVENGIDLNNYPFQKDKGDYFLWLSRIYPFKGTHRFIDICNKAKVKGIIAGGSFGDDRQYVDQIKTAISKSEFVTAEGQIGQDSVSKDGQKGVGISHEKKVGLYQNAKAVVIPSIEALPSTQGGTLQFIEPFGLIIPEANSCGTPVIVLPSGGWQETMTHGLNGFFANSDEEFIYYMKRIDEINPENCRKVAEHFSYQRMGSEYLKLFQEIIDGRGW
jgi:glycosyltransferase involved in cell wall biosynthesis